MSKYIDADALMKKLKVILHRYLKVYARIESVVYDDMPAADVEPVRKWIPVEEKRPEDGQVVNVITKSKEGYNGLDIVIYKRTGENGAFCTAAEYKDLEIYGMHVTHWTPVPDFSPKMDGGSE